MLYEASISGKWLAMLKEIAPRLERAALVTNPKTAPYYNYYLRAAESVSPSLGIKVVSSLVENSADLERTIGAFARTPNGGLLLSPDASTQVHRDLIIANLRVRIDKPFSLSALSIAALRRASRHRIRPCSSACRCELASKDGAVRSDSSNRQPFREML